MSSHKSALSRLSGELPALIVCVNSIGLPPDGKYHIDLNPGQIVFRGQSVRGTLVSSLADIDETLDFAKRGEYSSLAQRVCCEDASLILFIRQTPP